MNIKNITNIAKIIFRKNLVNIFFDNMNVNIYLKEISENEVYRFKKDCNELFSRDLTINIKSSI